MKTNLPVNSLPTNKQKFLFRKISESNQCFQTTRNTNQNKAPTFKGNN